MSEPGPMPWPMPGMPAEKAAAMVRDIRSMACEIALYRGRQGDKAGALAIFREATQSLQFIINNAEDSAAAPPDFAAMLQPASFAGAESHNANDASAALGVIALADEAIDELRRKHDWLRDGKRPA